VPQIETHELTKRFRNAIAAPGVTGALRHLFSPQHVEKIAVDRLDMAIETGESVAYVGPNGAGKSTTIKMLTGILVPSSGLVRVNGFVPHRQRIENARRIGVVFGQRTQLWWDLTVRDSLALQAKIYGVSAALYQRNLERFSDLLGMGEFLQLTARKLSLGQRMRADLAMALLHEPPVVYLDEPTIGLDLTAKETIRAFLKELNRERGTTILLTTHDLADMEAICRRIILIDQGKKIFDGGIEEMKDRYARGRAIRFQLEAPLSDLAQRLALLDGVTPELEDERRFTLRFDRFQHSAGSLTRRVMEYANVVDFHIEEPSIEDVIRQVYSGTLLAEGRA
jgi:ABC-2 type transport system ATP-binding protein